MNTIQKLAISVGITTWLSVTVLFFLIIYTVIKSEFKSSDTVIFPIVFLLLWGCSLIVAVGAYYNVTKRDNKALMALFVGGIILVLILGGMGFFILIWIGPIGSLWFFTPVVLSAITMFLALLSRTAL